MSSVRSKASTRRRKTCRGSDPQSYCSANMATSQVSFRRPPSITYLSVHLKAGESWSYQPPADHTVCWVALGTGSLAVPDDRVQAGELAVFEPSNEAIDFYAEADTEFVLGSAATHPHELALGNYSVHTSPASLLAGERRIFEIQKRLREEGRL